MRVALAVQEAERLDKQINVRVSDGTVVCEIGIGSARSSALGPIFM